MSYSCARPRALEAPCAGATALPHRCATNAAMRGVTVRDLPRCLMEGRLCKTLIEPVAWRLLLALRTQVV
eukprot:7702030-Pyramimonas_sp.AAC.1